MSLLTTSFRWLVRNMSDTLRGGECFFSKSYCFQPSKMFLLHIIPSEKQSEEIKW